MLERSSSDLPPNDRRTAIDGLFDELVEVRSRMLASPSLMTEAPEKFDSGHAGGARNLAHYLSMRARDMRSMQQRLVQLGLSSLGRSEGHALASVDAVLSRLGELTGRTAEAPVSPEVRAFECARQDLEMHTEALLGAPREGRGVRVLVTLEPEVTEDAAVLRTWIDRGMDCVRINCAHDGPSKWERMIAQVRRAEAQSGRRMRVLMDLGGPKLRTGPVVSGPRVLRIRPVHDDLGRVEVPARVWLSPHSRPPMGIEDAFALPVDPLLVEKLEVGDDLEFEDARGSARTLRVIQVLADGAWAETHKTSYVLAGTPLVRGKKRIGEVGEIAPLEGLIHLSVGECLVLTRALDPGHGTRRDAFGRTLELARIGCSLSEVLPQVQVGEHVWFDDGRIGSVVRAVEDGQVVVEITDARAGGEKLRADKGINLPDTRLDLPALTPKDVHDLAFVVQHADAVGLSFVHRAEDVHELSERLAGLGRPNLGIVLKIETRRAFDRLPELLFAALKNPSVGVMIARGDMAVECGWERLAEVQEEILWLCEAARIPVIWATQVLESLAKDGRPSRAEITDAAMSERAECVMLNKGAHVGDAILALDSILRRMQAHQRKKTAMMRPLRLAQGY